MENPAYKDLSKLEITVRALMVAWELHHTKGETEKADADLEVARWHHEMALLEKSRMDAPALARCRPLSLECNEFLRNGTVF